MSKPRSDALRVDLVAPRLTSNERRALIAAAFAADAFEPFVGWLIDARVLDRVIASGLVESGPSCRPAVGQLGYRLTPQGWARFNENIHLTQFKIQVE